MRLSSGRMDGDRRKLSHASEDSDLDCLDCLDINKLKYVWLGKLARPRVRTFVHQTDMHTYYIHTDSQIDRLSIPHNFPLLL